MKYDLTTLASNLDFVTNALEKFRASSLAQSVPIDRFSHGFAQFFYAPPCERASFIISSKSTIDTQSLQAMAVNYVGRMVKLRADEQLHGEMVTQLPV